MATDMLPHAPAPAAPARPRAILIDLALLFTPPLFHREILLYVLEAEGIDIICRSHLGRGTTRTLLRQSGLLHYFDDLWFGATKPTPADAYEVSGPDDDLFKLISHLTALYSRGNPLTQRLSFLREHSVPQPQEIPVYAR